MPTFLGIGIRRAGTTWLNTLLSSHPDVYIPAFRDEINFFDQYYDRGIEWYKTLFPTPEEAKRYKAIGEISAQYYEIDECPERILTMLPESRLIVILRHPVNRAYSQYGFFVQRRKYRGSFEDLLSDRPRALEIGFHHLLESVKLTQAQYQHFNSCMVWWPRLGVSSVSGTWSRLSIS